MPYELRSRVGVEIELLAPRGATRADVARAIATAAGGDVTPTFHQDSEPSAVPGMGTFRHLTRGFAVVDAAGAPLCSIVDDITVVADLDVRATPPAGWHRIVTDDPRLLNLLTQVCDPAAPLEEVLDPVARLFGTTVIRAGSIHKVVDRDGTSIAMAAPLPGERERPAEIVTPPLVRDHAAALERLLRPARWLGCTVPVEAAVHLHFDAAPFRTPAAFANVVALASAWRQPLRSLLGTNPACRRLGPPPAGLVDRVESLRELSSWTEVLAELGGVELTKYSDINLSHVVRAPRVKDTLEVRVLPGATTVAEIMGRASLVDGILCRCLTGPALPPPTGDIADDAATLLYWGRKE